MGPESFGGDLIPFRTLALFDYDALGRRIRATYLDKYQQITDDTLYYYDGRRVLAEFDYDEATGQQTLRRYFVAGPLYVDEHLLMHDATTGQDYYYLLQEFYTVGGPKSDSSHAF
ncbi:MAG: hypothetical protein ACE5I3_07330 [Phycisphaerae bacterium]